MGGVVFIVATLDRLRGRPRRAWPPCRPQQLGAPAGPTAPAWCCWACSSLCGAGRLHRRLPQGPQAQQPRAQQRGEAARPGGRRRGVRRRRAVRAERADRTRDGRQRPLSFVTRHRVALRHQDRRVVAVHLRGDGDVQRGEPHRRPGRAGHRHLGDGDRLVRAASPSGSTGTGTSTRPTRASTATRCATRWRSRSSPAAAAAACVGFLWWNASPARIFMGDTGVARARRPHRRAWRSPPARCCCCRSSAILFMIITSHVGHPDQLVPDVATTGLPDGAVAAPLRAGRLERGEHRHPLLDHRRPRRGRRRSACSTATSCGSWSVTPWTRSGSPNPGTSRADPGGTVAGSGVSGAGAVVVVGPGAPGAAPRHCCAAARTSLLDRRRVPATGATASSPAAGAAVVVTGEPPADLLDERRRRRGLARVRAAPPARARPPLAAGIDVYSRAGAGLAAARAGRAAVAGASPAPTARPPR